MSLNYRSRLTHFTFVTSNSCILKTLDCLYGGFGLCDGHRTFLNYFINIDLLRETGTKREEEMVRS